MINIYISENKLQYSVGTTGSRVKVKELLFTVPQGDLSSIAIKFLGKTGCGRNSTVNFIVDSPRVMIKQELLPCTKERKMRKVIKTRGVQACTPVENTVDEIMEVIKKHENTGVQTIAKTTVAPMSLIKVIEDLTKAFNFKINSILTAQECMNFYVESFTKKYFPGVIALIDYKDNFATIAAYNNGKEIFAENYFLEAKDSSLAYKRLVDLAHRAIVTAKDIHQQFIEKIYIVGDLDNIDSMLEPMSLEVGVKCLQLPLIDEIVGVSYAEFNEFFASIAGIMINK